MRVKFLLPLTGLTLGKKEEESKEDDRSRKGSTQSKKPKSRKKSKYQKGNRKKSGSKSKKGSSKNLKFKSKPSRKNRKSLKRSRKIKIIDPVGNSNFGPYEDIVVFPRKPVSLSNMGLAKSTMQIANKMPFELRFFVDADEIRDHKIVSAVITVEKPATMLRPPRNSGLFVSPATIGRFFERASARDEARVLSKEVITFEDLHENKEKIQFQFPISKGGLDLLKRDPKFATLNPEVIQREEDVETPLSSIKKIRNYRDLCIQNARGMGPDPGAEINRSNGEVTYDNANLDAGIIKESLGTERFIHTGLQKYARPSGPTGQDVHANKMSESSASLAARYRQVKDSHLIKFQSNLVPVVVSFEVQNPGYNTNVRVKISLKARTSLGDQVIASGSKTFRISDMTMSALEPSEPPNIKTTSLGSGQVQVSLEQKDKSCEFIALYAKFRNEAGETVTSWSKVQTVRCKNKEEVILDFSNKSYYIVSIRALPCNKYGEGKKYAESSAYNLMGRGPMKTRSPQIERLMPTAIAVRLEDGCGISLRNTSSCSNVCLMREDLTTGDIIKIYSATSQNNEEHYTKDRSVKLGSVYRYFIVYTTGQFEEHISYKDTIYKHSELSQLIRFLSFRSEGFDTSVGQSPSLRDDTVSIKMTAKSSQKKAKEIVENLESVGVKDLVSDDLKTILSSLEEFIYLQTTRIDTESGHRCLYNFQKLSLDVDGNFIIDDNRETRRRAAEIIPGPVPGREYIYLTRVYTVGLSGMLGKDTTSKITPQNPSVSLQVIRDISKRFFPDSTSQRGILRSEQEILGDDDGNLRESLARGFTGLEFTNSIKIPEDNNQIKNVIISRRTDQVHQVYWEFFGNIRDVDHFVVFEESLNKCVPVAGVMPASNAGLFNIQVNSHNPTYDKSYKIIAYGDSGMEIAKSKSQTMVSHSILSGKFLERLADNSYQKKDY